MQIAIIIGIGTLLILGLLVIAFTGPNAGKKANKRLKSVMLRHSDSADTKVEGQMRKALASRKPLTAANIDQMGRADRMRLRLARTGKNWTLNQYLYASLGLAVALTVILLIRTGSVPLSLAVGIILGAGLPHMIIGYLIKKRLTRFTVNFPDGIELMVRGLRSGLPVAEILGVIATELDGPVGEEFKLATEKMRIGKAMEDALQDTSDRLGISEFQFFVITLAIQRETGGNLSETLANLAEVLRKRAQMKLKIKAMSSESKASAYIVGSLPFIVYGLISTMNPDYVAGFFFEPRLMIAGLGGLIWMGVGVLIMAKMVSFEI